jgi:hypothetical protein
MDSFRAKTCGLRCITWIGRLCVRTRCEGYAALLTKRPYEQYKSSQQRFWQRHRLDLITPPSLPPCLPPSLPPCLPPSLPRRRPRLLLPILGRFPPGSGQNQMREAPGADTWG